MANTSLIGDRSKQPAPDDVTDLLQRFSGGDADASEEVILLLYDELRQLATSKMRHEGPEHTLQPTALVHDIWLKVTSRNTLPFWSSRSHFFGWASRAMADHLCDHARHKNCQKAGGQYNRITLEGCDPEQGDDVAAHMLEVRDALEELAKIDETQATILRLKSFSTLSKAEIASAVNLSVSKVERALRTSGAWLRDQLQD